MKKLVLVLFAFSAITVFGNTPIPPANDLETPSPAVASDEVPAQVLTGFYNTFIFNEEGKFTGAWTGEIENYASMDEIITIVHDSGVQLAGNNIYEGYKPKLRGCKKNSKWICSIEGDVVTLD
ncbi:MAG: hypothetical protein AAFZ15_31490 [Bacteroidota bacterium]